MNPIKKSLKSIQKNLGKKDQAYITIRRVYPHLSMLSNQEILDYYHVKNIKELEDHIKYIKKWTMPIWNWSLTLSQLAIFFEGRLDKYLEV
jgi:transposase-like protein